jgi:hypothetical protein
MQKLVEHSQSNRSAGRSVCRTVPLMEVVPPPKNVVKGFNIAVNHPGPDS